MPSKSGLLITAGLSLLFFWFLYVAYSLGGAIAAAKIQDAWNQEKQLQLAALAELQQKIRNQESRHQEETQRISDAAVKAQSEYQATLLRHRTEFTQRLQQSESRAGIYQRQASGNAIERSRLAEHAARLDRSLEEGRSLVRELRDTVEHRDRTILTLSQQIKADRRLLTN